MKDVKAKILLNENICASYYRMGLEAPYIAKHGRPGQFVMVKCSDGQDPLLRRPLGIHRVKSGDKVFEMLYEVVGKGTEILSMKKSGDHLSMLGPIGNGFTLPKKGESTILIAGGIGVAPLVFLGEELKRKKIKPVVLLGAKTKKLILSQRDFKSLGAEVHLATDDGTIGHKGFVSQLLKKALQSTGHKSRTTIYACGPSPMLKSIAGICKEKRISCEVLLEEKMACGTGVCLGCAVKVKKKGYKLVCKDGPVFKASDIVWE